MSERPQDSEGFLQRWSRRKREGLQDAEDLPRQDAQPEGQDIPSEDPELIANREAAEAVDLESLTYESDFTVFMKRGVPEALKTTALRKLWRSNPALAVLDGLNDYDTDFRAADTLLDGFQSAWKIGRGYADKAEELKAEMEARSAEPVAGRKAVEGEPASPVTEADDVPGEEGMIEGIAGDNPSVSKETADRAGVAASDPEPPVKKIPRRRRMAFDIDD